jgi:hypothetical protein
VVIALVRVMVFPSALSDHDSLLLMSNDWPLAEMAMFDFTVKVFPSAAHFRVDFFVPLPLKTVVWDSLPSLRLSE